MLGVTGIACAQMTDAQVIEAVKSAQAQGKSQDEIILMLSQKGVTKEQVLRIKENYESCIFPEILERNLLFLPDLQMQKGTAVQ